MQSVRSLAETPTTDDAPNVGAKARTLNIDRAAWIMLIGPPFVIIFVITAIPTVSAVWTSLQSWNLANESARSTVWLGNYIELFQDASFWHACALTAYQVIVTVVVQMAIGVPMALLFARTFRGVRALRTLYILPMMATPVVVGLMWRMLFNTDSGMVNYLLGEIGIGPIDWLGDALYAMPSVIFADVWMSTPLVVIIVLAGLQSVDRNVYEAAAIDGATGWKRFWHITLPLLRPMLMLAILFRTMDAIRRFDSIYVMTGGGPGNATETLDLHAYFYAFNYLEIGKGSAVAVVMFAIIAITSGILIRLSRIGR